MKILIVAPHADDEILGVGGTIARYIDNGNDVYVCIATRGDPSMFPNDMLKKLRSEVIDAHRYLGIKETFFLDFPAVILSEIPKHQLNNKIKDIVVHVKPQIVYIPHFGDMHLDHYLVSQSTMVAVRPIEDRVLEIYSYETLSETEWNIPHVSNVFIPNTYVDVSDYLDKKITAMSFFTTQLASFPHPRSLEAIKSLAKLRGSTVGVDAAEAFCMIRKIVI